jgi:hypothetical protein
LGLSKVWIVFGLPTGSRFELRDHEFVAASSGFQVSRVVLVRAVEVRIGCDKFWMLYHHRLLFWFCGKITSILPRPRRDSQESRSSFRSVDAGILGLTWQIKTRRLAKDAFRSLA